jgi:CheY-like chemotaxis protein
MRSDAVLIIGNALHEELLEALFEAGLTAVARPASVDTFARVRQRSYDALIIDAGDPERDVLEVVLNIRDYDEDVPILVLAANRPAVRDELLRSLGVRWLNSGDPPHEVARSVQNVTDTAAKHRGHARLSSALPDERGESDG